MAFSERMPAMRASNELGAIVLFQAAGRDFTVEDAIAAAMFRGELDVAIRETFELAEAESFAEETGHELERQDLQTFSERFRYERDLITAGETEHWLQVRGLTTDDFSNWMTAKLYSDQLTISAPSESTPDAAERLRVHLWMSGLMDRFDRALQRRVAAQLELGSREPAGENSAILESFFSRAQIDDSCLENWLEERGRDRAWVDEIIQLEDAYERFCEKTLTMSARASQLASMGNALEKIGIQTLDLDSETAAREAVLCVREDRISLHDVARESGFRSEYSEVWLEEMEASLGQHLFCAEEGEALDPIEAGEGFRIFQVVMKKAPSIDDPDVITKLDEMILDAAFAAICSRHIRLAEPFREAR